MSVICVKQVSKYFPLQRYRPSLRHEALKLMRQSGRLSGESEPGYWALRDISFDVEQGESVAIIGRNGAGKTTLLRILSGITTPTAGTVQVKGRSASLIGLSAGFDMQHSGRDNILLNAAIFGVPPRQARNLMDTIIAFAELEAFIDLPVKTYSSGMIARLGFSIAMHILPSIVFLDEILSVGDVGFQQKCSALLRQMRSEDRSFVIVSHSVDQIDQICSRTIWLENGQVRMDGDSRSVVSRYRTETLVQT